MKNEELALKSLIGLWVGDCIGNMGQLYNIVDILKAFDEGIVKFGINNIDSRGTCFQYSDDTDEAIVLFSHLVKNGEVLQDKLAMEFAARFMYHQDGGEYMGYGLMTRKVLKNIYDGVPWREANLTFKKSEGMSSTDNVIAGLAAGKTIKESLEALKKLSTIKPDDQQLVGSCGNGSVMRIPPLGAYMHDNSITDIIKQATLSAEPTHSHPEGVAGAIAIALLSNFIASMVELMKINPNLIIDPEIHYKSLLSFVPKGEVWNGIEKASKLSIGTPLAKLIEILGNGTHVTCQDTVPLCVFLTIKALTKYPISEMYEKVITEVCQCSGDVDTNCAIVGGMIGIIGEVPTKWIKYCQPMEGLLDQPLPIVPTRQKKDPEYNKDALKEALNNTTTDFSIEDQTSSLYETATVIFDSIKGKPPTFDEVLALRKSELKL